MKTWEVYKALDEWDTVSKSRLFRNKENNLIYKFVFNNGRKGLKINENSNSNKTQYHFSLNGEWEEVIFTFNIGDIVVNTSSGKIYKITGRLNNGLYECDKFFKISESVLRLATKDEIKLDEIKKKWANIKRNYLEFKEGDIVKDIDGCHGYHYRAVLSVYDSYLRCTGGIDIHMSNATLVVPVERRFDK